MELKYHSQFKKQYENLQPAQKKRFANALFYLKITLTTQIYIIILLPVNGKGIAQ